MNVEELIEQATFEELKDLYENLMKPRDLTLEGMWQLRHWDGMDGTWIDIGPAQTPHEALKSWFRKTEGGQKATKFDDLDYYRIFPATTVMKWSDGREMFRGDSPIPPPDPLILLEASAKRRPPWRLGLAAQLLSTLEKFLMPVGWHCGITGSVLHQGESRHDLDVILYPRDASQDLDKNTAREVLRSFGMTQAFTVEQVHEGWRTKGGTDTKHVEVWHWHYYRIDIFFLR